MGAIVYILVLAATVYLLYLCVVWVVLIFNFVIGIFKGGGRANSDGCCENSWVKGYRQRNGI